jgi:hypothetical protein
MIKPTVGRPVWYYPPGRLLHDQPLAAVIVHIFNDRMVNLAIFLRNGNAMVDPPTSIPLLQDGDENPPTGMGYCTWMPYQIAKASEGNVETAASAA